LTALRPCLRNCGKTIALEGKDKFGQWIVTDFEGGPRHKCRGKRGTKKGNVNRENKGFFGSLGA